MEEKLDAWLDLLDAAGLATVCEVDGNEITANTRARDHLAELKCKSLAPLDVAEALCEAGITPNLAEPGLCVWKVPVEDGPPIDIDSLSRREREVAEWQRQGKSAADIAERLGISPRTVEKHTQNIFTKCGVRSHIEFIQKFPHGHV